MQTINNFTSRKGINRSLSVEIEGFNVDLEQVITDGETTIEKHINLDRKEALSLIYYLIKQLLPNKLLVNNHKNYVSNPQ